ncbi:MAG: 3-methyl-2-oxobutanoate dehydrogenase subunit VorB [Spirochaetota bacterium]|nr:3-methyl-2-oxobutanoate dehydrogenase subunit VorB [Spirochaetota bacterium]
MGERIFVQGNEAIGWGALSADCDAFFGYPITPQNEATEWFAREFPKNGKVFVQTESETGSINMLFGAASAGVRCMTSTSSPGWGLMQEGISHIVAADLPCVIALVQRGGPGAGTTRHAQTDYKSVVTGGGPGDYKNIVLAPASVQEIHDLVQMAFYLSDKYRNPVILLSDGILGQIREPLEIETIDFGELPYKDWALRGRDNQKDKGRRFIHGAPGLVPTTFGMDYNDWLEHAAKKFEDMLSEVRYEIYNGDDAELLIIAYGYPARSTEEAVNIARKEGYKVGMIRPITLWPFPEKIIKEKAQKGCNFIVVEDSLGQMVDDVKHAVCGMSDVHLLNILDRHLRHDGGMLLPGRIYEEIKKRIK